MSVTGSVGIEDGTVVPSSPRPRRPRRDWTGRLSLGHGLMIGAGLLAALLNLVLLRGGEEAIRVLVAAQDIQPGERLTGDLLDEVELGVEQQIASRLIPADRVEEVVGRVASARIAPGEPLLRSAIVPEAGRADGLRAMSVPVDLAHAVGGRLRIGDRIDVIEVRDDRAVYVATGLEVIGINVAGTGGALDALGSHSVTVAIDDGTALRLAAAIRADRFELVRSTGAEAPGTLEHRLEHRPEPGRAGMVEGPPPADDEAA